jgi:glyoxylase-like metal-dependent hydrolase (beta-lactamase superfamily II)
MKTSIKLASTLVSLVSTMSACSFSKEKSDVLTSGLKGQIHVFESDATGFNTKTFFYDNGTEVVAFDTQFTPALAEQALAYLRTKTQNPVSYVVVTHPNPDKFNGISVFKKEGAKIIASEATAKAMADVHAYKKYYFVNIAKMFTEDNYPKLDTVDLTFPSSFNLNLANGEQIKMQELKGPGVSSNQTVALVPDINALVVGDLIHHNAHAWLEGGIVGGKPLPTVRSWIKALEELSMTFAEKNPTVFGGRGEAVTLDIAAAQQIKYLEKADEIVTSYVKNLGDRRDELNGANAGEHYAKIQAEFEAAFPAYQLAYMIQYGVYGLALSK